MLRPATPRVLGTLSIIFGCLGACQGTCQSLPTLGLAADSEQLERKMEEETLREFGPVAGPVVLESNRTWAGVYAPSGVAFLVLSVGLFAIGLGQLRYRRWACRAGVVWSVLALAVLAAIAVAILAIVGPAQERAMTAIERAEAGATTAEGAPEATCASCGPAFGAGMAGTLVFFLAPYPIVMLALSTRRYVVEAMRE